MLLWLFLVDSALGNGSKSGFEPPTIIASHRGGFSKTDEILFQMPKFSHQYGAPPGKPRTLCTTCGVMYSDNFKQGNVP